MFVVRPPSIVGTPRLVSAELGWRMRKFPNPRRPLRMFDYQRDFFMTPIPLQNVRRANADYSEALSFFTRNKYGQRKSLEAAGIPVPRVAANAGEAYHLAYEPELRFVVRPLRHSGGRHYRITDNPGDFVGGQEYISELYPKRREYRVIFVFGQPVVYLRKKPNEGVSADEPWGHVNSVFSTINDIPACRLSNTDCVSRLLAFPAARGAHLIAADILYNRKASQPYVVLELNACPALTISENRAKIVQAVRSRNVLSS